MKYPVTPDGRYFLVKGRLWRCSNPALGEEEREKLVKDLMDARRAVKDAHTEAATKAARARVNSAKIALGERGPVWWTDGAPDVNRYHPKNTDYLDWWRALPNSET